MQTVITDLREEEIKYKGVDLTLMELYAAQVLEENLLIHKLIKNTLK